MDAAFVGEGVGPHDRLVGLHQHSGEVAHQAGGLGDLFGTDRREGFLAVGRPAEEGIEVAASHVQGHHQLLEGGVAGPLADAVDRALELAGSVLDGLEEIGHGKPEIVVAVHRDHRLVNVGDIGIDAGDKGPEFGRGGVTDGVGDVDRGGPRPDRNLDHLVHEFRVAAAGVFARELDVIDQGTGVGHHLARDRQHLGSGLAQLVLEVDIARGDEGVDAMADRRSHRLGAGLDVTGGGPGQPADHRTIGAAHLGGDALHRLEITAAGEGEPRLDDIDPQTGELLGDRQLLVQVQAGPRRLLTIPQGGVEDQHPSWILGHGSSAVTALHMPVSSNCKEHSPVAVRFGR